MHAFLRCCKRFQDVLLAIVLGAEINLRGIFLQFNWGCPLFRLLRCKQFKNHACFCSDNQQQNCNDNGIFHAHMFHCPTNSFQSFPIISLTFFEIEEWGLRNKKLFSWLKLPALLVCDAFSKSIITGLPFLTRMFLPLPASCPWSRPILSI